MDASIQSVLVGGVSSIATVIAAEIVKRQTGNTQARMDDRQKFTTQLSEELAERTKQYTACEAERRRQDNRIRQLEYVIAQVAAEATTVGELAEEVSAALVGDDLVTDARRLAFSALRLKQLARRPEESEIVIGQSEIETA